MRIPERWVDKALVAIMDLIEEEVAVGVKELEARLSEGRTYRTPDSLQPHVLTEATRRLLGTSQIEHSFAATRGSNDPIRILHLPLVRGQKTRIERRAARKRLLIGRYNSYNRVGKRYPKGLIGSAGENALHTALRDALPFRVTSSDPTEIRFVHGEALDDYGGPIDDLAFLTVLDDRNRPKSYTCMFEIKNRREWIYKDHVELLKFLAKAAHVQLLHPDEPIVPVFVSRKRHETTLKMGQDLGFFTIQFHQQFVRPVSEVDRVRFQELRGELGCSDMILSEDPNKALAKAIGDSLVRLADDTATTWRNRGCNYVERYEEIARIDQHRARSVAFHQFRLDAKDDGGSGGW